MSDDAPPRPPTRDLSELRDSRIFSELEPGHAVHDSLTRLWQAGLLNAWWDEDAGETAWELTPFGEWLTEHRRVQWYLDHLDHFDDDDDGTPAAMEVLPR
ncbi:hypothetical protein [Haloarchaeobius sp. DFWS5]|uniref:hypothetical protein n=1 Tax=Haloarchaeobius sp. DFWS5 TaxID=3446114 RepID=UPI003EBDBEA7